MGAIALGAWEFLGGLKRFDWKAIGVAVLVAALVIGAHATVARLVDGAVAEWKAEQDRAKLELVERMATAAAEARKRYEQDKGAAVARARELSEELAKFTDGDPVVFPEALARRLNQ